MTDIEKCIAYIEAMYERTEFTGDDTDGVNTSQLQNDLDNYIRLANLNWFNVNNIGSYSRYFYNEYMPEGSRAEHVFLLKPKYNHKIFTFISPSLTYYKFKFNGKMFDVYQGEEFFYNSFIRKEAIDEMLADLENNNNQNEQ